MTVTKARRRSVGILRMRCGRGFAGVGDRACTNSASSPTVASPYAAFVGHRWPRVRSAFAQRLLVEDVAEEVQQHLRGEEAGDARGIVGRRDLDAVDADHLALLHQAL